MSGMIPTTKRTTDDAAEPGSQHDRDYHCQSATPLANKIRVLCTGLDIPITNIETLN